MIRELRKDFVAAAALIAVVMLAAAICAAVFR
jgi:hypothetical protein